MDKEERGIKEGEGSDKRGRVYILTLLFSHFKPC